ncbi:ribosome recycling factor [Egicoccus halophilus]|uniref:Ribosome-recycling factor n=1 Tax=Egicoccus halophilus TaxID=1670830 RepID=A0A8J3A860_9ACTN|nr:ribosome recycling factor [Egicoccus halophilus]GGI06508.1 ribosome-recycling factor [Egicoccus halophilus]
MSLDDIALDAEYRMDQAVDKVGQDFGSIRTGRANPQLLNRIQVDYYGAPTPLQQLANFSVPEPRILVVNPFDKGSVNQIEKAIRESDLGLNPSSDGGTIRCVFPELTEERRKDFIRMAKQAAEDGKVAVRNVRRNARDQMQKLEDSGEVGQDEHDRYAKQLEELTAQHVAKIDKLLEQKEKDLLEV